MYGHLVQKSARKATEKAKMNGLKLSAEISELSQGALEGIYEEMCKEILETSKRGDAIRASMNKMETANAEAVGIPQKRSARSAKHKLIETINLLEETEKISLLDEAAEYGGIMEMANWGDPIEGKASGYSFQSGMVAKSPSE